MADGFRARDLQYFASTKLGDNLRESNSLSTTDRRPDPMCSLFGGSTVCKHAPEVYTGLMGGNMHPLANVLRAANMFCNVNALSGL